MAQWTCRTEAYALLGVWPSEHKDPSLQTTKHTVWTFFKADILGWGSGESGTRRGGWEGLGSKVSKANLALWALWGDEARPANVKNKECRGAGMNAPLALFPRGAFMFQDFLASSCRGSVWSGGRAGPKGKGCVCCFLRLGGRESSVHSRNKPGEGVVKGSNHRMRPFWAGNVFVMFMHSRMPSFIHSSPCRHS